MPPEYRTHRVVAGPYPGQLAALFAVQLEPLLSSARNVNAIVITDTRGHWASPYILTAARAGVMEVYPNHTFQPDEVVRRAEMARAVSRVLELVAQRNPQLAAGWRASQRKFPDLGPGHPNYPDGRARGRRRGHGHRGRWIVSADEARGRRLKRWPR